MLLFHSHEYRLRVAVGREKAARASPGGDGWQGTGPAAVFA
jgi:hypothetical protein